MKRLISTELCGNCVVALSIFFLHAFSWLAAWPSLLCHLDFFFFYTAANLFLHQEMCKTVIYIELQSA